MTARITISCDGSWSGGEMRCRAALHANTTNMDDATDLALIGCWSTALADDGGDEIEQHYCPACTRLAARR